MINPLDMRGPQFLGFYLLYGLGVFLLLVLLREIWNRRPAPSATGRLQPGIYPTESDAYIIALLRGGSQAVARSLLGRLVAEELFILEGSTLRQPAEPPRNRSRLSPLEEEAFRDLSTSITTTVEASAALANLEAILGLRLQPLREELEGAGLVPAAAHTSRYRALGLAALVAVSGLGLAKLLVALARGRTNVLFLVILLGLSVLAAVVLMKPPRLTQVGKRYLSWLADSHRGLMTMLAEGRRQSLGEVALIAGIFGIETLPFLSPLQQALVPRRASKGGEHGCGAGSSSCSSGGSSCSGGGSGCGSGCGGGGCGGCGG
jgi:uncharacterized protein (TIGR04222 family)